MAGCKLGVEGAKVVAEMAAVSRSLSRLLIGSNAIGDTGCIALAEAMQQNDNCKIEELNLHRNVIGAPGAKSLAAMMAVRRSLTQVLARFIQPCSVCLSVLISGGLMHRSTSLTMHSAASSMGGAPTLQRGSTQSLTPCA